MRDSIWKCMLDADMNSRYWKLLANKMANKEKKIKIFLAIIASTTVASWGVWVQHDYIWKFLSACSAIVSVALPILNYPSKIENMTLLAGHWGSLRIKYEDLWTEANHVNDENLIKRTYSELREVESTLQIKESNFGEDKKLLKKCQEDVIISRGI
ncbi:hypothetical protein P4S67_18385 [Pseudoalteromonas sp. B137]